MRALFVAPYLPTPGSGGRTRLINLMRRLSGAHELRIVAFAARDQEGADPGYPGVVVPPPALRARPGGMAGKLRFYGERLDPLPAFVQQMFSPAIVTAIAREVGEFRPHLVQVETTEMAQYLRAIPFGPARVLDLQDVASGWFERAIPEVAGRKQRALMRVERGKTRAYDRRHARIPEAVLVSSEDERALLRSLAGVDPVVVPNGVNTREFAPDPAIAEEPDRILFVGPLTYDANLDGLRWFCRDVLPLVRAEIPGAQADHVGEPVSEELGARMHGRVPDVRPWLARAPLSVVPVRYGSGTRYKILEALSMGRCVVSTSIGAEGLGLADGEHLLIADEPAAFAAAVVRALRDPALRARLGAAGRAHVAARYDWEPLVARVDEVWSRVASTR
jgi:glycosyltransferase involved in cell wall biosynthesis